MIYIIWIVVFLSVSGLILWVLRLEEALKREKTEKTDIQNELINTLWKPFIIGKITKYTQKEIDALGKNHEFVDIVMKYLEYEIAINTDKMRSLSDWKSWAEKAWYLNALHATYLFFFKLKNKKPKKQWYTWKELV